MSIIEKSLELSLNNESILFNKLLRYNFNIHNILNLCIALKSTNSVIAGGSILSCFSSKFKIKDLDIYVQQKNSEELSNKLIDMEYKIDFLTLAPAYDQSFFKKNSIITRIRYKHLSLLPIDLIIISNNKDVLDVIKNFDLSFCEIWFDGENVYAEDPIGVKEQKGVLNPEYSESLFKYFNKFIIERIKKYTKRGFDIEYKSPQTCGGIFRNSIEKKEIFIPNGNISFYDEINGKTYYPEEWVVKLILSMFLQSLKENKINILNNFIITKDFTVENLFSMLKRYFCITNGVYFNFINGVLETITQPDIQGTAFEKLRINKKIKLLIKYFILNFQFTNIEEINNEWFRFINLVLNYDINIENGLLKKIWEDYKNNNNQVYNEYMEKAKNNNKIAYKLFYEDNTKKEDENFYVDFLNYSKLSLSENDKKLLTDIIYKSDLSNLLLTKNIYDTETAEIIEDEIELYGNTPRISNIFTIRRYVKYFYETINYTKKIQNYNYNLPILKTDNNENVDEKGTFKIFLLEEFDYVNMDDFLKDDDNIVFLYISDNIIKGQGFKKIDIYRNNLQVECLKSNIGSYIEMKNTNIEKIYNIINIGDSLRCGVLLSELNGVKYALENTNKRIFLVSNKKTLEPVVDLLTIANPKEQGRSINIIGSNINIISGNHCEEGQNAIVYDKIYTVDRDKLEFSLEKISESDIKLHEPKIEKDKNLKELFPGINNINLIFTRYYIINDILLLYKNEDLNKLYSNINLKTSIDIKFYENIKDIIIEIDRHIYEIYYKFKRNISIGNIIDIFIEIICDQKCQRNSYAYYNFSKIIHDYFSQKLSFNTIVYDIEDKIKYIYRQFNIYTVFDLFYYIRNKGENIIKIFIDDFGIKVFILILILNYFRIFRKDLETYKIDEKNITNKCYEFFEMEEYTFKDFFKKNNGFIFIYPSIDGKLYSTCLSRYQVQRYYDNRAKNWFFECNGDINKDTNDRELFMKNGEDESIVFNALYDKTAYIRIPVILNSANAYIPANEVASILSSSRLIYYVLPYLEFPESENKQRIITHSVSYGYYERFLLGDYKIYMSTNHCQNGSGFPVYTLKVCNDEKLCVNSLIPYLNFIDNFEDDSETKSIEDKSESKSMEGESESKSMESESESKSMESESEEYLTFLQDIFKKLGSNNVNISEGDMEEKKNFIIEIFAMLFINYLVWKNINKFNILPDTLERKIIKNYIYLSFGSKLLSKDDKEKIFEYILFIESLDIEFKKDFKDFCKYIENEDKPFTEKDIYNLLYEYINKDNKKYGKLKDDLVDDIDILYSGVFHYFVEILNTSMKYIVNENYYYKKQDLFLPDSEGESESKSMEGESESKSMEGDLEDISSDDKTKINEYTNQLNKILDEGNDKDMEIKIFTIVFCIYLVIENEYSIDVIEELEDGTFYDYIRQKFNLPIEDDTFKMNEFIVSLEDYIEDGIEQAFDDFIFDIKNSQILNKLNVYSILRYYITCIADKDLQLNFLRDDNSYIILENYINSNAELRNIITEITGSLGIMLEEMANDYDKNDNENDNESDSGYLDTDSGTSESDFEFNDEFDIEY